MQRHAFLIMAHNNWYTLETLLRIIDRPWCSIYLHIDKKVKDFPREKIFKAVTAATLKLTRRHNVTWGNESQVKAEMSLFKSAHADGPFHYYHFLSGSDLPLKSAEDLYAFFADKDCNFLQCDMETAPFEWRLRNYINVFRAVWMPAAVRKRLNVFSEIIQYKLHTDRLRRLKARYPKLGKGHNWCDLTEGAVTRLVESASEIRRFTRFTHCSDEMYKQIVLMNEPAERIGSISDYDIRYIDWSAKGNHPRALTIAERNTLIYSGNRGGVYLCAEI